MRTVDEHLAEVLAHAHALESLDVSLLESRGCLLAAPVTAPWALPPFDSAGIDGYAVMAADIATATASAPTTMPVTDDVPAGYRSSHPIAKGTAIRIGSGAPLPSGATAVVPFDLTDGGMPTVSVHRAVAPGHGSVEPARSSPRARRSCPPARSWGPVRWPCWPPWGRPG